MLYAPRRSSSGSRSIRNQCDGQGYPVPQFLNESIFLICHPYASAPGLSEEEKLALGLGLGLGIPLLYIVLFYCFLPRIQRIGEHSYLKKIAAIQNDPFAQRELVQKALTPSAYQDFCQDILTLQLREELMILRSKMGRNLTEFVKVAEQFHASTVATQVDRINPCEFPPEILRKGRMPPERPPSESRNAENL